MKKTLSLFFACWLITMGIAFVYGQNLLNNADFENGDLSGWQTDWEPVESGALCSATAAYNGNYGAWIYSANNSTLEAFSSIYQDITSAPGDIFTASGYIRTPPPGQWVDWVAGSYACVRVSFLSESQAVIAMYDSTHLTTGDTPYGILYTVTTPSAPVGTASVRFSCYIYEPAGDARQSVVNFDDCNLQKIEPEALLVIDPTVLGFGHDLTNLTFDIENQGTGTLTWNIGTNENWIDVTPTNGTTTTEKDTITVTVDRSGLSSENYKDAIVVTTNGGNKNVDVYMEIHPSSTVPGLPSIVTTNGYQLIVQRRLADESLDIARSYTIKGVAWSPAEIGTLSDYPSRRLEFQKCYRLDLQMIKEMNGNTIYTFLDFDTVRDGMEILDYCYHNKIMVIMTADEDGTNNTSKITEVINAYKSHPAILMWALGNEWNILRPNHPFYYHNFETLSEAANAMQSAAQQIKSLDTQHPVCSILGEITSPSLQETSNIVNNVCTAVDVWGANIYRGPHFGTLFSEWASIASKPLYLSEFGTDAFHTTSWLRVVIGYEDETMQADHLQSLWSDLVEELSAKDSAKVCLGGTVFEWID